MHVSSAYRFKAVSLKACGRSLIYIKKKSGPRIEPCGIPHVIKLLPKKLLPAIQKIFYSKDRIWTT